MKKLLVISLLLTACNNRYKLDDRELFRISYDPEKWIMIQGNIVVIIDAGNPQKTVFLDMEKKTITGDSALKMQAKLKEEIKPFTP